MNKPPSVILAQAGLLQGERCIPKSAEFSAAFQKPVVFLSFLAFPNPLFTVGMVAVIMVLVHGAHCGRRVHDRDASLQGIPKQPGIPSRAADDKSGDFLIVQAFVEHEIVDPLMRPLVTCFNCALPEAASVDRLF